MADHPPSSRKRKLEPITYDEIIQSAGMSGFVSFLERTPATVPQEATVPQKATAAPKAPPPPAFSPVERILYLTLWEHAQPLPGLDSRQIRAGYRELAKLARLAPKTIYRNLRSLILKHAIEITSGYDADTRTPKSYRVHPPSVVFAATVASRTAVVSPPTVVAQS